MERDREIWSGWRTLQQRELPKELLSRLEGKNRSILSFHKLLRVRIRSTGLSCQRMRLFLYPFF